MNNEWKLLDKNKTVRLLETIIAGIVVYLGICYIIFTLPFGVSFKDAIKVIMYCGTDTLKGIVLFLILSPIHELLHASMFPDWKNARISFKLNGLATTNDIFSRRRFLVSILMPTIFINCVLLILWGIMIHYNYKSGIIISLLILEWLSSCSDIRVAVKTLLIIPKGAKMRLNESIVLFQSNI